MEMDNTLEDTSINSGYGLVSRNLFKNADEELDENLIVEELVVASSDGTIAIMGLEGTTLKTYQDWDSGYTMNTGAGITIN